MASTSPQPSFWQQLTSGNLNPVWSIRMMSATALLTGMAALWLFKSGSVHAFFLGVTVGILVGVFAQTCHMRADESYSVPQPSDVDDLRVTRISRRRTGKS